MSTPLEVTRWTTAQPHHPIQLPQLVRPCSHTAAWVAPQGTTQSPVTPKHCPSVSSQLTLSNPCPGWHTSALEPKAHCLLLLLHSNYKHHLLLLLHSNYKHQLLLLLYSNYKHHSLLLYITYYYYGEHYLYYWTYTWSMKLWINRCLWIIWFVQNRNWFCTWTHVQLCL